MAHGKQPGSHTMTPSFIPSWATIKKLFYTACPVSDLSGGFKSPPGSWETQCIELLDHVITGERNHVSLKEKGFL